MNAQLELIIDDLGAQGDGIAHHDNQTIFVADSLAGERVVAETGSDPQRARVTEIIQASADRVPHSCPHFPRCGGCRVQHLAMPVYTDWKLAQLRQTLGGLDGRWETPFVAPPLTRRRARLAARCNGQSVTLGFNEWRSHQLVDVVACAVLLPEITEFIQRLRGKLPQWLPGGGECDVQVTSLPGGLDVVLIGGPALGVNERMDLAMLAEALDIAKLSWRKWDRSPVEPVSHRKPLSLRYGDVDVPFPPGSFLQATAASEQVLIDFAIRCIDGSAKVLDLFAGLGGFGLSMNKAKQITFADLDGPAIVALQQAINGRPRYRAQQRNLIKDPYGAQECDAFDAVIFDPPRGGAKAQAERLAASRVPHIVAVSCDPASFARDANILLQGGYRLQSLLPVDQFLWSTHMEVAAHFTR